MEGEGGSYNGFIPQRSQNQLPRTPIQVNPNHDQENLEVEEGEEAIEEKGEGSRESNKRPKKGHTILIKGQLTGEEDRRLIRLAEQYGERKWAEIAANCMAELGSNVERGGIPT